jgi:divalent metal cation (Fe/Co/Zn/Cd) transporter
LLAIKISGIHILDPIIAIFVAIFVLKSGFAISKKTLNNLLDCSLPDEDLREICNCLDFCKSYGICDYKDLKARRLGPNKKLEVTLIFPNEMTIAQCHEICDKVENCLTKKIGNISTSVHLEPIKINFK